MAETTEFEMDPVTYQELEQLEDELEDVEMEMLRQQYNLSKDLNARRAKVVAKIPHFWPLVIDQSPPDIDEYIQPTDSALLMNALTSITVDRFELPGGDPRSISIKWEFSENDHFEDKVLEKKFHWRNAKDGWAGLVSEPVQIKWKEGKDLTNGMLDLVRQVYDEEQAAGGPGKDGEETEAKKKLKAQMESTGLDGLSFFAWFGFRGRKISEEEHREATIKDQERRKQRKEGKKVEDEDMDEDEDDDDDDEYEWEIFPTADDLAVCIADDLWPNAIKYFLQAQEMDNLSDIDFEDASDEEMGDGDDSKDDPPNKKRKA